MTNSKLEFSITSYRKPNKHEQFCDHIIHLFTLECMISADDDSSDQKKMYIRFAHAYTFTSPSTMRCQGMDIYMYNYFLHVCTYIMQMCWIICMCGLVIDIAVYAINAWVNFHAHCVTISHRMRSRNTQKITPPFWFWISDNVVCVLILADRWATFFIHLNQTTTLSAKLAWLSHGWIQKAQFSSVEFKVDSQPMFHTKSRMCPQDHLQNRVV